MPGCDFDQLMRPQLPVPLTLAVVAGAQAVAQRKVLHAVLRLQHLGQRGQHIEVQEAWGGVGGHSLAGGSDGWARQQQIPHLPRSETAHAQQVGRIPAGARVVPLPSLAPPEPPQLLAPQHIAAASQLHSQPTECHRLEDSPTTGPGRASSA